MSSTAAPGVPDVPDTDDGTDSNTDELASQKHASQTESVPPDDGNQADPQTNAADEVDGEDEDEIALSGTTIQAEFGVDDIIEVPDTTETSLDEWGLDVGRQRETKYEQETASQFGIDDRVESSESKQTGEQSKLFPDTDDEQLTLTGEKANQQSLFEQRVRRQQREAEDEEKSKEDIWRSAKEDDQQETL